MKIIYVVSILCVISNVFASYIEFPRIHFSGLFDFAPPTWNNDGVWIKEAYDSETYEEFKDKVGDSWSNRGTQQFSFRDMVVTNIYNSFGRKEEIEMDENGNCPLEINKNCNDTVGILVDIDTSNQLSSTLYGFSVVITDKNGNVILSSNYEPSAFRQIWFAQNTGDMGFGPANFRAQYTSILTNVIINNDILESVSFNELKECALKNDNKLQIKFTTGAYRPFYGTIKGGIIGCYTLNEPKKSIYGRHLKGFVPSAPFPNTQFVVMNFVQYDNNDKILHIDLMNAIPTDVNDNIIDIGDINIKCNDIIIYVIKSERILEVFNDGNGGIVDIYDLEEKYVTDFNKYPLIMEYVNIMTDPTNAFYVNLAATSKENINGYFIQEDKLQIRLGTEYNTNTAIPIYGSKFGQPINDQSLDFNMQSDFNEADIYFGIYDSNWPQKLIHDTKCIFIDGVCNFTVSAPDITIKNESGHLPRWDAYRLDSILYDIFINDEDNGINQTFFSNVLVFDESFEFPIQPSWIEHIKPIFRQYAFLYPSMRPFIKLEHFEDVTLKLNSLQRIWNQDFLSNEYMPITRDLSEKKRIMINKWIHNPSYGEQCIDPILYSKIETIDELKSYLQDAINLELSTIPPYLSALYSIKPDSLNNFNIKKILEMIVAQEMTHVAIAANLLISIGGKPKIFMDNEITKYPVRGLPANIHNQLRIELQPLTKEQINDVFIVLESPGETINIIDSETFRKKDRKTFKHRKKMIKDDDISNIDDDDDNNKQYVEIKYKKHENKIGSFYNVIREGFRYLTDKYGENELFKISESNVILEELGPNHFKGIAYVYNLNTAIMAINDITREGEGTSLVDLFDDDDQLSHYHQFLQIYFERLLVEVIREEQDDDDPDTFPFVYIFGPRINFNKTEIERNHNAWNWLKNINHDKHENANDIRVIQFNKQYQRILCCLDDIFRNGKIDQFPRCLSLMRLLQISFNECLFPKPIYMSTDETDPTAPFEFVINQPIAPNWLPPKTSCNDLE